MLVPPTLDVIDAEKLIPSLSTTTTRGGIPAVMLKDTLAFKPFLGFGLGVLTGPTPREVRLGWATLVTEEVVVICGLVCFALRAGLESVFALLPLFERVPFSVGDRLSPLATIPFSNNADASAT